MGMSGQQESAQLFRRRYYRYLMN